MSSMHTCGAFKGQVRQGRTSAEFDALLHVEFIRAHLGNSFENASANGVAFWCRKGEFSSKWLAPLWKIWGQIPTSRQRVPSCHPSKDKNDSLVHVPTHRTEPISLWAQKCTETLWKLLQCHKELISWQAIPRNSCQDFSEQGIDWTTIPHLNHDGIYIRKMYQVILHEYVKQPQDFSKKAILGTFTKDGSYLIHSSQDAAENCPLVSLPTGYWWLKCGISWGWDIKTIRPFSWVRIGAHDSLITMQLSF